MILSAELAQQIIDKTQDILDANINVMDARGVTEGEGAQHVLPAPEAAVARASPAATGSAAKRSCGTPTTGGYCGSDDWYLWRGSGCAACHATQPAADHCHPGLVGG